MSNNWTPKEERYFALCASGAAVAIVGTIIMFVLAPSYAWMPFVGGLALGVYGESQNPFEEDRRGPRR